MAIVRNIVAAIVGAIKILINGIKWKVSLQGVYYNRRQLLLHITCFARTRVHTLLFPFLGTLEQLHWGVVQIT